MKSKTKAILRELESYIKEKSYSLSIFKGYTAINKQGAEKIIDELYANLPEDVKQAREYLKSVNANIPNSKRETIYDNLNDFETELDKGFSIATYTIVNIRKLEELIDRIYCSIPKEIDEAEKLSK